MPAAPPPMMIISYIIDVCAKNAYHCQMTHDICISRHDMRISDTYIFMGLIFIVLYSS